MGLRERMLGPSREVELDEALRVLADGGVLVDVRPEHAWRAGTAAGAANLPRRLLARRLNDLPPGRRVVLVCGDGRESAVVARALARTGVDAVNVRGGLLAWRDAKHPLLPGRARLDP